jgi:Fe-S-cluster containining protein
MIMLEASGKGHFFAEGLRFSCKRCSACCRFEAGYVFLSQKDASVLCAALNIQYGDFLETYCRWVPSDNRESQLSLKEKQNYDCVFWSPKYGEGCSVYESRPLQCRTFPFWTSVMSSKKKWKMTAKDCPGMDQGTFYSQDSIKKMLGMRQMEPIIFKNT